MSNQKDKTTNMEDLDGEIWKDIPNYEGLYMASNMGRIKSLERWSIYKDGRRKFLPTVELKGTLTHGHKLVVLTKNKKVQFYYVHQLIAMSFLGHVPNKFEIIVDHIDHNRLNNKVSNLQLITVRENVSRSRHLYPKTSKYIGVSKCAKGIKWSAAIQIKSKTVRLGNYYQEDVAALHYQTALENIDKFNGCIHDFKKLIVEKVGKIDYKQKP